MNAATQNVHACFPTTRIRLLVHFAACLLVATASVTHVGAAAPRVQHPSAWTWEDVLDPGDLAVLRNVNSQSSSQIWDLSQSWLTPHHHHHEPEEGINYLSDFDPWPSSELKIRGIAYHAVYKNVLNPQGQWVQVLDYYNLDSVGRIIGFWCSRQMGSGIPSSLGDLSALEWLSLSNMTGSIPSSLGSLSKLESLGLGGGADGQHPFVAGQSQ